MYTDEDLQSAVDHGALSAQAADSFRAHVDQRRKTPLVDEEQFHLVTGFNDIFVVIACALLLISLGWMAASVREWMGALAVAAASWGLAEFFVRQRHMALPAIVLLLTFVGGLYALGETVGLGMLAGSAFAVVGAVLHWRRFAVPITVAAGAAAFVAGLLSLLVLAPQQGKALMPWLIFAAGVSVFALALWWDAADPLRRSRKSDVAFWLHLLASPLMVHPLFVALASEGDDIGGMQVLAISAAYVLIALVSMVIDRRALMVSALGYVLYAFSALLKQYGYVTLNFAFTAFIIGSGLLLVSVFWHRARATMFAFVPSAWQKKLAPLQ